MPPGTYNLTVSHSGFTTATVTGLQVEVNKSTLAPVKLGLGATTTEVTVTASGAAQLQTTDAQIGNVIPTNAILHLPTLQRNATELMNLEPATVAGGSNLDMRVSGALDDQNTVTLDGIDITQNVVAGNTSVPTPADSVEEFRGTVANPGASLMRASGGQVTLVGRRGTKDLHGAAYEYLQNTDLNANTWDNNRQHQPRAGIDDNRFGGRLGGQLFSDKTFFFVNYEGRRFKSVSQVTRTVPTSTLKSGIVELQGPNGLESFNLGTAAVCGPTGTGLCDPRSLGVDPSVAAQWKDMPAPNLTGVGDGLNTSGYFFNVPTPINTNYEVLRLDHTFSPSLSFNGTFTYWKNSTVSSSQVEIINGSPASVITTPQESMVPTGQLNWQISPNTVNVFRFGWVRDSSQTNATPPSAGAATLNIPGTKTADGNIALLIGSGVSSFIDSPIDMDTQRARFQGNWTGDFQYIDDLTKISGAHTLQFGASANMVPFTHARADKVLGSITSLVALVDGDQTNLTIPATDRPETCSATVTANCVPATQVTNWDRYYASSLGLVDNIGVLEVRDANLNPLPLGTFLRDQTNQWATYFYGQDTWRMTPDLTFTYGLSYGWQTAPTEKNGLQTIMTTAATGTPITASSFLQSKEQAALKGQIFNPTFGFVPVNDAHLPVYNVDWGDIAPRIAVAWNPGFNGGVLGSLFGNHQSVLRAGYAIVYDRSNSVQAVEIPMLGIGFDENIAAVLPTCAATGAGGTGCNAASADPGLSSFRVGTDGTLPLPTPTAVTSPVVPAPGAETLSFQVDPNTKVGRSYDVDFSLQRQTAGGVIIEAAYLGRFARDLPQAINLNSSPYMFVDPASGQSFAQAYDAVANALRAGQAAPDEPFFDNQFPGLAAAKGTTGTSTAYIASHNAGSFSNGLVGNLFLNLDGYRRLLGLQAYDSDQAQVEFMRTYIGYTNYNAGTLTITKRLGHGLTVNGNYTYSKSLDDDMSNQNNAGFFPNSFNTALDYGPSSFDRTSVINAFYEYDIPATGFSGWLGRAGDGWYTSGVFTTSSGLPLTVSESSQVYGGGTSVIGAGEPFIPQGGVPVTGLSSGATPSACSNTNFNGTVASKVLGSAGGSGMDIFGNPGAAFCAFDDGYIQLSSSGRTGRANPMRGLGFWNFDTRLGKTTKLTEKVNLGLSADFFNLFNHQNFSTPNLSIASPSTFGVITSTSTLPNRVNAARFIELGLRFDF